MENKYGDKKPLIILRALCIFLILGVIIAVIYYLSYHHYSDVAEWKSEDLRDVLIYKDEEYILSDKYGTNGLNTTKYKMQRTEGEVKIQDFKESLTNVILVASVKDYEDLIVVTYEDGERYVYYKAGTHNPTEPQTDNAAQG